MGLQKGVIPEIFEDPDLLPREAVRKVWCTLEKGGRKFEMITDEERKRLHDILESPSPADQSDSQDEGIVINDTLGTYDSSRRRVTLYTRAIELCSRADGISYENLYLVVLGHELSHAGNHLGLDDQNRIWDSFVQATTEEKEYFAQIYPHHLWSNEGRKTLVDMMKDMTETQPKKYGQYLNDVSKPVREINAKLLRARV
jgi:hypothetical protein